MRSSAGLAIDRKKVTGEAQQKIVEWASKERGKELAELMSNGTFVYGAETARKWLALLREWQKATRPV